MTIKITTFFTFDFFDVTVVSKLSNWTDWWFRLGFWQVTDKWQMTFFF